MKKLFVLLAAVLAVALAFGPGMASPPDKMILKEIQKTKAPVAFDHKAHTGKVKECKECHHKDAAGKEQKCSTASCHGGKADGKKVELKEACHTQCKGCHKKEKAGPVKCDECHPKKK
ncbi:MAG TPA: cytochrome c3 family protein [Candidatus Deferrimicrobiaceae bacterium]